MQKDFHCSQLLTSGTESKAEEALDFEIKIVQKWHVYPLLLNTFNNISKHLMQIIYFLKVISPSSIPLYLLLRWGMYILCYSLCHLHVLLQFLL